MGMRGQGFGYSIAGLLLAPFALFSGCGELRNTNIKGYHFNERGEAAVVGYFEGGLRFELEEVLGHAFRLVDDGDRIIDYAEAYRAFVFLEPYIKKLGEEVMAVGEKDYAAVRKMRGRTITDILESAGLRSSLIKN